MDLQRELILNEMVLQRKRGLSYERKTAHRPTGKPTTALPQDSNANQHGLKYYAPLGPLHAATFHSSPPWGVSTALLTTVLC
jgi:hypothetical protein